MLDNLKIYDFKGSDCKDTDLTLSKFMLEAADICPVKSWRAIAIDKFGSQEIYRYDFGIGSGITDEEMKEVENSIHLFRCLGIYCSCRAADLRPGCYAGLSEDGNGQ